MTEKGSWRWADGVGHFFLRYHPYSVCLKEHRIYAADIQGKRKCKACSSKMQSEKR